MRNSVQSYMKSSQYWSTTFHKKLYDIRVQSNFVSAQTAQWELYFQCNFCDKVFFLNRVMYTRRYG